MKTLQRILTLVLFLTITTATAKAAGEWIELGEQNGIKFSMYTDITFDYIHYKVWLNQDYLTKAARASAMKGYKLKKIPFKSKVCIKFDRNFSEMCFSSIVHYGSKGDVISSLNMPYDDFEPIVPGTLGETWADIAQKIYKVQNE